MIEKPRLKKFLTVFPISETVWGLRGGHEEIWRIKLKGEKPIQAFGSLLPYLDGRHRVEDILRQVEERGIDPAIAQAVLSQLEQSSLLEENDPAGLTPEEQERFQDQLTFFSHFTSEGGAKFQALLRDTPVALVGDGKLGTSVLQSLHKSGFGDIVWLTGESGAEGREATPASVRQLPLDRKVIRPEGEDLPALLIVAQESHDPELLEAMDVFSKERRTPWLLLRLFNRRKGWVGPLFVPGDTASYLSMEARFRSNIPFYDEYVAFDRHVRSQGAPPPLGGLFSFYDLISAMAVTEVIKFVTGFGSPQLAGKFLTIDLVNWDFEIHEVLRVPRLEGGFPFQPRVFPWKEIPYVESETVRT